MYSGGKFCNHEDCYLGRELREYNDVEIHYLFHSSKCLECNNTVHHKIGGNSRFSKTLAKQELSNILGDHKNSIRHDCSKKRNNYYKKRFNSIIDYSKFYDIHNKINSNNNSITKYVGSEDQDVQIINSGFSQDFRKNKKIKLENKNVENVNNIDDAKYLFTILAENNIPIKTVEKLFKDQRIKDILVNSSNRNLKELFQNFDFLKPIIFNSKCIKEGCKLCATTEETTNLEKNHYYWSFDIIELLKSLLLTDLINEIAFYPNPAGIYSLYSSSEHFLRVFSENLKSLNVLVKINVDIESIDGHPFNMVYISIGNTISGIIKKRFYLGSFPLCVQIEEALTNILKPLLYNREEIITTIKLPLNVLDPDIQSNPLPIKAIQEAIYRKECYINKKQFQTEKEVSFNEEFFDILISYINLNNENEDSPKYIESGDVNGHEIESENRNNNQITVFKNQEDLEGVDDYVDEEDGEKPIKYCSILNEQNEKFIKIMDKQEIGEMIDKSKYNNVNVFCNINEKENNSSEFSSFFGVVFTILDISGSNIQIGELFSRFSNPNRICSFCCHPRNQILDFAKNYELMAIEKDFVSKFLNRTNEKLEDEPTVKHFIGLFKDTLGIEYSSIPLYLLNFKDLYNPFEVLFYKELEIIFDELTFIFNIIKNKLENNIIQSGNKKYEQLKNIVNTGNKFQIISFIEDTNTLVHFLLELKSIGILKEIHLKCFLLHLKYFFKLRKESYMENDLNELTSNIIEHHEIFVDIYKNEINNQESILLNLHSSKHWSKCISLYGSPIYFSLSYSGDELVNEKVNYSICKNSNYIKHLENQSKQFNLLNEKLITSRNIHLNRRNLTYSSVLINGKLYKSNLFYSVLGAEEIPWYCQIQKIKESSIVVKYFERQNSCEPSPLLQGVTQRPYLFEKKEYEISLSNNPESLLERVYPIIIDGYYYFISSNNC